MSTTLSGSAEPFALRGSQNNPTKPIVTSREAGAVADAPSKRPHVVIVGAGFGGLSAAVALARAPVDVTIIDRRNYHLFQPLLYQVATAGLNPADIAGPIRSIVSGAANTSVILGRVDGVDKTARCVTTEEGHRIAYDYLIVATGARHAYFGHDEWEPFAPGLKKIEDATAIRRRILLAFEKAETEADPATRAAQLTFVIVGAGPTGVELAGALAELAKKALTCDFRNIDTTSARIILIEAGSRLLPSFPESLSAKARRSLEAMGVEVRLGVPVTSVDGDGVIIAGERITATTVLWAAGVAASAAAKWLGGDKDRIGRVIVNEHLEVPGHPEIFVIGDTAHCAGPNGKPLPGVAPVAKQQGKFVARTIGARLAGKDRRAAFRYRNYGNMATIGRKSAVADFGRVRLSGLFAWLLWSVAHIYFLIGFRNRLSVVLTWSWAYVTYQRGSRLITG